MPGRGAGRGAGDHARILVGTFAATFVALRVFTVPLAIFFAVFMAYVSVQVRSTSSPSLRRAACTLGMSGLGIGGVSALVAIGALLVVPFMTWCNVKMQNAIGTWAAMACASRSGTSATW